MRFLRIKIWVQLALGVMATRRPVVLYSVPLPDCSWKPTECVQGRSILCCRALHASVHGSKAEKNCKQLSVFPGIYTRDSERRNATCFEPGSPVSPEYSVQETSFPRLERNPSWNQFHLRMRHAVVKRHRKLQLESSRRLAAAPRESGAAACLQGLSGAGLHCTRLASRASAQWVPSGPVTA